MANLAIWIFIFLYGLWVLYQRPFYIVRWYNTTDAKESKYFGWRIISQLCGCYAWFLFFSDFVFEFIDTTWPTLFSLYLDNSPARFLMVISVVIAFFIGKNH